MKKRFYAGAIVAFGLLSGSAFADEYLGPAITLSGGWVSTQVHYDGAISTNNLSNSTAAGKIGAEYGFPLDDLWISTLGAAYSFTNVNADKFSYFNGSSTNTLESKFKERYSVYFAPGYRFASDWLAYAKFSFNNTNIESDDSGNGTNNTRHSGFGYGAGVSYLITPNFETGFEIQHTQFQKQTYDNIGVKPSLTESLLTIKYRF